MKHVIIYLFAISAIFFSDEAFASYDYTQGYFDKHEIGSDFTLQSENVLEPLNNIIDNDLSTAAKSTRYSGGVRVEFLNPTNIRGIYIDSNINPNASVYIDYSSQYTKKITLPTGYSNFNYNNVTKIRIVFEKVPNTSINEFEIFTDGDFIYEMLPVSNLKETHTDTIVNLSWKNPQSEYLSNILIYQDDILIKTLSNSTTSYKLTKLSPETEYIFKVIAKYKNGEESEPTTISVTTDKTPLMAVGEFDVDPSTGDYIYKWTEPTTGKVKVLVGGKPYKTVNASDFQIVIPADDIVTNVLGVPDVQLIPIDEDGTEGIPIKPPKVGGGDGGAIDGVEMPFTATNLMKVSVQLLLLVGGILLLSLAFIIVPNLRKMIVQSTEGRVRVEREGRAPRAPRERKEREEKEPREPIERPSRELRETRAPRVSKRKYRLNRGDN